MTRSSEKTPAQRGANSVSLADLRQRIVAHAETVRRTIPSEAAEAVKSWRGSIWALLDVSGSMEGDKLAAAKAGLLDFAKASIANGHRAGLIAFEEKADVCCELTGDVALFKAKVEDLEAGGSTDLAGALALARSRLVDAKGERVVLVVTDGYPDDAPAAVEQARAIKADGARIVTIGTEDADRELLALLASEPASSVRVPVSRLREQIAAVPTLLLGPPR